MKAGERTKREFARVLREMAAERPYNEITVRDLCARCDMAPQTFYYHFRDKTDLATWSFLQDLMSAYALRPVEWNLECATFPYKVLE